MKPRTAELIKQAKAEVQRLRALGWKQEDFAKALRRTLEGNEKCPVLDLFVSSVPELHLKK